MRSFLKSAKALACLLVSVVVLCSTATATTGNGKIAIYFNQPVNNTVSTGVNAVYLNNSFADTIVAYINRAKYSIDIAQYDYNQSSGYANIATAVNNAALAGKKVRWIYDGSQSNTGIALLNSSVHTLASPTGGAYGIMHDKFIIIDANSTNPNDAIVSTGSEDWGITQFNLVNNNIMFLQDSALAHAYLNQFNMMWGDTGITPNATLSKFGPYKTDLGQHIFNIGGKLIELYFSPADATNTHILSSINSANTDLYFGVYSFTVAADANAIVSRQTAGVYTAGIVDQYSNTGAAYPILTAGLGSNLKTFISSTLLYHNKMLIVDPSNTCSDPLVLTGSHNWTTSANTKNDENTLIIHSDTIANIYYQAFNAEFAALSGTLNTIAPCVTTTCGTPTALPATAVTTTTALLNWTGLGSALSYTIQYRVVGTTTWSTTTATADTVTISGLTPATNYEFQVQATCSGGSGSFSGSSTFTTLALPCSVPTGLDTVAVNATSATLSWVNVTSAVSYTVQYRPVGTASWYIVSTPVNSITISGLSVGVAYEYQVEVNCGSGTSGYSNTDTFTTVFINCTIPTGQSISNITDTTATLHWNVVAAATGYTVRYRPIAATIWMYASDTTNTLDIANLIPNTTYEFEVRAICTSADSSGFTGSSIFITNHVSGIANEALMLNSFNIFPNPVQDNATISYRLNSAAQISISVYNLVGQEILAPVKNELQQPGTHNYSTAITAPGVYFVKLTTGQNSITKRVVKL